MLYCKISLLFDQPTRSCDMMTSFFYLCTEFDEYCVNNNNNNNNNDNNNNNNNNDNK